MKLNNNKKYYFIIIFMIIFLSICFIMSDPSNIVLYDIF
jgi:hypothetical protein